MIVPIKMESHWKPDMQRSPNDLAEWYPLIKDIVPTPKTEIIDIRDIHLLPIIDGEAQKEMETAVNRVKDAVKKIKGYPCFFRTGLTSNKHSWIETCFLDDENRIGQHIYNLTEFSAMADVFGPSIDVDTLVVRELLFVDPVFFAFRDMPITLEMRIFVDNGEVVYIQPYWPKEVFEGYVDDNTIKDNISYLHNIDKYALSYIKEKSIEMNKKVPGYWSIDWLCDSNKNWWMTDMALGKDSYKYDYDQSKFDFS